MDILGIMILTGLLTTTFCHGIPTGSDPDLETPIDDISELESVSLTFTFQNGSTLINWFNVKERCLGPIMDVTRGFFGLLQEVCGGHKPYEPKVHVCKRPEESHDALKLAGLALGAALIGFSAKEMYLFYKQKRDEYRARALRNIEMYS